jgi:hypothetical protein
MLCSSVVLLSLLSALANASLGEPAQHLDVAASIRARQATRTSIVNLQRRRELGLRPRPSAVPGPRPNFALFAGFDANQAADLGVVSAASPTDCLTHCQASATCQTFTFAGSSCYLSSHWAPASAAPSQDHYVGLLGTCAGLKPELSLNAYASSLEALCADNALRYRYARYQNYDQRQGNFAVGSFASSAACADACAASDCIGFTFDSSSGLCYQNRIWSLAASSPNAGKTMGILGTCATTKQFLPSVHADTQCVDDVVSSSSAGDAAPAGRRR